LGASLFAFAFTLNVTVVPEEEAVPEVEEGVSQLGTLDIEYFALPLATLRV
jgi:hypothetical protein